MRTETVTIQEYLCSIKDNPTMTRKMVDGRFVDVVADDHNFTISAKCPGGGYLSNVHSTWPSRAAALAHAEKVIARLKASEISHLPTRAEYEAACARQGYTPLSDADIAASAYSMEYGDYSMPHYSVEQAAPMILAQARYRTLKAGIEAAPKTTQADAPVSALTACPNCGTLVAEKLLMYASLGMACPNCYDEMEESE